MTDNDVKTFLLDVQLRGKQAVNEMYFSLGGENMLRYCLTKKYIKKDLIEIQDNENIINYWNFTVTKKGLNHASIS